MTLLGTRRKEVFCISCGADLIVMNFVCYEGGGGNRTTLRRQGQPNNEPVCHAPLVRLLRQL